MSTLTNHYNIAVQSRFYAFLQEDCESAEPQTLIATAEKKREMIKENKSKAKKEKRAKQIAEIKKENIAEEFNKIEEAVADIILINDTKGIEAIENVHEENSFEKRSERRLERGHRGRGSYQRGDSFRNEEKFQDDDTSNRTQNDNFPRHFGNNRARTYRKERTEEDSFNKVGYFEEESHTGYRGGSERRRPYSRGGRFSRGNDREVNENLNTRIDSTDRIETFEDRGDRPPQRGARGRYPRSNRGSFNRFHRSNDDESGDFEHNKIGFFDENVDSCEYRGSGRPRGGRGMRRGSRSEYRKPREQEPENCHIEANDTIKEDQTETGVVNWDCVKDEINLDRLTQDDPMVIVDNSNGFSVNEDKKTSDWVAIDDDPGEVKVDQKITMTLDEWKAHKDRTLREIMDNKEDMRKANDGRDVFSGMSEYRKGKGVGGSDDHVEDVVHEVQTHDSGHTKVKQSIPVSVRFSRSMDFGGDVAISQNYEQGGASIGGGGRGRSKMSYNSRGGRDFGRSRGRGSQGVGGGSQYNQGPMVSNGRRPRRSENDNFADVSINLGNEEEFPHLS